MRADDTLVDERIDKYVLRVRDLLNDQKPPRDPELDAIARSGDFFVTLATKLENIAGDLPETSTAAPSLNLSKLAQESEYMQRH